MIKSKTLPVIATHIFVDQLSNSQSYKVAVVLENVNKNNFIAVHRQNIFL